MAPNATLRFAVISTCPDPWGGSEELWARATPKLLHAGHRVRIYKTRVNHEAHPVQQLQFAGCEVFDLERIPLPLRFIKHMLPSTVHVTRTKPQVWSTRLGLEMYRPHLVLISQGQNLDGMHHISLCKRLGLPYVVVCHKATDFFWPKDNERESMRRAFAGSVKAFFVSEHTLKLTEEQIGERLDNAEIVRSPFLVPAEVLPWPANLSELKLACVARLHILEKGQDVLLRVLASQKWKDRSISVSFFGKGVNRNGLISLAKSLGIKKVSFDGFTDDVASIWKRHHALVLPSRCEGLPLSLIEAMMCGRPAIVTDVGGNAEAVEDGVSGFVATSPSESALNATLEIAWNRRTHLRQMGLAAAERIRKLVPTHPEELFAERLLELASSVAKRK